MNRLEKRSFSSFLLLYIGSSFLFLAMSGFWYYKAQKNALENTVYYKLQHYSDTISGLIINAQMHGTVLKIPRLEEGYEYFLVRTDEKRVFQNSYFQENGYTFLASTSPQEHLNIRYVVVKTDEYHKKLLSLRKEVLSVMTVIFLLIVLISFVLAKLFMRPIHQKVLQIEQFIQDISHELNTPVTALQMSSKRAMQKGVYDEKILKNISISTKQLYTIYRSLSYLSFSDRSKEVRTINLKEIIKEVVEFYSELCLAKNIAIILHMEDAFLKMDEDRARLLFSNLLSNAIKYSMPDKRITLTLTKNRFLIQDEGVGIEQESLKRIFDLYERGSKLAGGFGVGLSIVKQICDEAGIKIEVESRLNQGSSFKLSWEAVSDES
ncbi:HAMP domain-containing sensor histidine kinase [Sulfurimonas sp. HSL-1716]|uniref:sensor histidine kinase n=1 Tax=Hydrocurvibacter sulfurireducens TaxID=3131937 RepID=UPI0031F8C5F0